MWRGHVSRQHCKGEKARRALKDTVVNNTSCFFSICFFLLFLPPHFKHNTVGHIPHTKNNSHLAFGHELLRPVFKTSQFRHTQASFVTCYWDQKHFLSLLTGGNIASNWKGVPFIICRSDTDEVLGEGRQRSQDSGCCSARNLYLQRRSCMSIWRGARGHLQRG